MKPCTSEQVRNPATGRCVSKKGAIGRKILGGKATVHKKNKTDKSCPSDKIMNPETGRCVSRKGAIGKKILAREKRDEDLKELHAFEKRNKTRRNPFEERLVMSRDEQIELAEQIEQLPEVVEFMKKMEKEFNTLAERYRYIDTDDEYDQILSGDIIKIEFNNKKYEVEGRIMLYSQSVKLDFELHTATKPRKYITELYPTW